MMLIATQIAASTIQGVGIFAAEFVRKGQKIWMFQAPMDVIVTPRERALLPAPAQAFLDRYAYPAGANGDDLVLNCDDGRFMNHSDQPNTDFAGEDGYALTDIPAGVEITCDYREFYPEASWYLLPFLSRAPRT